MESGRDLDSLNWSIPDGLGVAFLDLVPLLPDVLPDFVEPDPRHL
jgi:hypothetical protein